MRITALFICVLLAQATRVQCVDSGDSNSILLQKYILSKGVNIIVFDESNIKQFWIDNSVLTKDNRINIILSSNTTNGNESVPLRIQLANVNEAQDCKVEVISETEDFGFSVLNNSSKVLSSSKKDNNFLNYSVASTVFHLEDTTELYFKLKFNSKISESLSIIKIILSFSSNKESTFLVSPGTINYSTSTLSTSSTISSSNSKSISVTGKQSAIFSNKKIITMANTFVSSVTIKNIGDTETTVYVGYGAYTQDGVWLNARNYPVSDKVLKVLSSQEGSTSIFVDAYSDWKKGYYLALNAQEDFSDIPNNFFAEGTISEIKKKDNGQAEIILSAPIKTKIKEGTKVRIHGYNGAYLYTGIRTLQPGEEHTFSSTIKKDESYVGYSSKAFSKGVYYVIPLILSYTTDPNKKNTILISNFSINY